LAGVGDRHDEQTDQKLMIPAMYSPFPFATHSAHAAINQRTSAWAQAIGLGSEELRNRLVKHAIGTFAARILPEGDERVVQVIADFIMWVFVFDDGCCEEGSLGEHPGELAGEVTRLLRIAQHPAASLKVEEPLAAGLRDLRRRVGKLGTPIQAMRWVHALREYGLGVVWEAHHRNQGTFPTFNDYTLMRLHDGAVPVVQALLELGRDRELGPEERDCQPMQAVCDIANFIISWDNDILSFHKESRGGRFWLNAIRVLGHERGLPLEEALRVCIAQRDQAIGLYLRLREYLARNGSTRVSTYLKALDSFIRGAQEWEITSIRYTSLEDPHLLPDHFINTPSNTSTQRLDMPSLAWWWEAAQRCGVAGTVPRKG
jgi:hypothetical protein